MNLSSMNRLWKKCIISQKHTVEATSCSLCLTHSLSLLLSAALCDPLGGESMWLVGKSSFLSAPRLITLASCFNRAVKVERSFVEFNRIGESINQTALSFATGNRCTTVSNILNNTKESSVVFLISRDKTNHQKFCDKPVFLDNAWNNCFSRYIKKNKLLMSQFNWALLQCFSSVFAYPINSVLVLKRITILSTTSQHQVTGRKS